MKVLKRTIAIAKGEYIPKKSEPKVWFESIKSMAQVLSNENQELLRLIVELIRAKNGAITPKVKATDFKVQFGLNYSHVV